MNVNASGDGQSNKSRNVQLLTISHDDSFPRFTSTTDPEELQNYAKSLNEDKAKYDAVIKHVQETDGDEAEKNRNDDVKIVKKIDSKQSHIPTRVVRNDRTNARANTPVKLVVPAAVEDAVHNYRIEFIKHIAKSSMYANPSIKKPWEAVARISEELIEDALSTVTEELEMETLLQQMIDVELKDFNVSILK